MSKPIIVECIRCDWFGSWDDLEEPEEGYICPTCGSIDSFVEREDDNKCDKCGSPIEVDEIHCQDCKDDLDGVSEDDYREQNPQEVPRE